MLNQFNANMKSDETNEAHWDTNGVIPKVLNFGLASVFGGRFKFATREVPEDFNDVAIPHDCYEHKEALQLINKYLPYLLDRDLSVDGFYNPMKVFENEYERRRGKRRGVEEERWKKALSGNFIEPTKEIFPGKWVFDPSTSSSSFLNIALANGHVDEVRDFLKQESSQNAIEHIYHWAAGIIIDTENLDVLWKIAQDEEYFSDATKVYYINEAIRSRKQNVIKFLLDNINLTDRMIGEELCSASTWVNESPENLNVFKFFLEKSNDLEEYIQQFIINSFVAFRDTNVLEALLESPKISHDVKVKAFKKACEIQARECIEVFERFGFTQELQQGAVSSMRM